MDQRLPDCLRLPPAETDTMRYVINPDVIDCPLGDGLALFDGRSCEYYSLNGTAALMWHAARAPTTRSELVRALQAAHGAPDSDQILVADMNLALRQFLDIGLFLPIPYAANAL